MALRLVSMTAIFVVPLVFYIRAYEAFNLPKGVALIVLGGAALSLLAFRNKPLNSRAFVPSLLFVGCCALSMIRTPLFAASLERLWEIGAIIVLLWAAETEAVPKRRLLALAVFTHFIVTLYGAFQYMDMDFINWTAFGPKRVYSTMGNPNFLAAQTSLLFPLAFCLIFAVRSFGTKILLGTIVLFALPSLLYTQTRGAIVAFAASCLALLWASNRVFARLRLRHFAAWTAGGAAVLAVLLLILPTGRLFVERFREFADPVRSPSMQTRLFYGYSGWLMGTDYRRKGPSSPVAFLGSGIGAFHLAGARTQGLAMDIWQKRWPRASEQTSPHLELYAHNDYIHVFAELGILGLGVYLWILACLFFGAWRALAKLDPARRYARWLLIGLFGSIVCFGANTALNFLLKVPQNAHLFIACIIPLTLAYSGFRSVSVTLPGKRFAAAALSLLTLYGSARACAKLAASQYLKDGHNRAQAVSDPSIAGRPAAQNALLERALAYYEKSRRLRPFHTDAILDYYYSGVARQRLGDEEGAMDAFGDSIRLFRYFPEGHRSRGLARLSLAMALPSGREQARRTQFDAARKDLEYASTLNPKDVESLFNLGYVYQMLNRHRDAVASFKGANYYSGTGIAESYYFLAVSLIKLDRLQEAAVALETLLARFPNHRTAAAAQVLLDQLDKGQKPRI